MTSERGSGLSVRQIVVKIERAAGNARPAKEPFNALTRPQSHLAEPFGIVEKSIDRGGQVVGESPGILGLEVGPADSLKGNQ